MSLDLRTWIKENDCLDKIHRYGGYPIYIVNHNHKNYFIKRISKTVWEYEIAKELEPLSLPTFQRPGLLLSSNQRIEDIIDPPKMDKNKKKIYYYILSEEIKGKCLLYALPDLSRDDLDNILQVIFFSLRSAWENIGFVHLDLHLGNIMLIEIDSPIEIKRSFSPEIIINKYLPVIIDFDRSITKTHMNDVFRDKTILNDIWKLLGTLSLYAKDDKGELVLDYIEQFIDRYEFQERKEDFANEWFYVLPSLSPKPVAINRPF